MGVLLQAAYKLPNGASVPSPHDGNRRIPWWWDRLAAQATAFRDAGFTAVLLPPVLKTNAGAFAGADGYGPFDDYDIGSKNQYFSTPTRFGSREQLQRMAAIFRANGLDIYLDMVLHHRDGGINFRYEYLGADGAPKKGRFPKTPKCFFPNVPRDPIAGPVSDDFGFGDEFAPINAVPAGYVMNGLIDAGDWLTAALDAQGYRLDDTKGLAVRFVSKYLASKAMAGKFAVGEYFDGNPDTLNWWVWNSGMNGRSSTFDFGLRFTLHDMCNNNSRFDMTRLDHAGFAGRDPMHAVTFLENHDTDLSSPVIWNKMIGYAYLLTSEGYPMVYYKDYSDDVGCYGMKPLIDNLIWIHEVLANGSTTVRFKDFQCIVYERTGWPNLLVGLNNDQFNGWRTITAATGFGANVQLHDYSGHAGDVWTDQWGNATVGIPPNNNGMGYVCYSRAGQSRSLPKRKEATTQVFEGADDLDIGPAIRGEVVTVGRIWCDGGTAVHVKRIAGADGLEFSVSDMGGHTLQPGAKTAKKGWYRVQVKSNAADRSSYKIAVTYTAPEGL